MFEVESSLVVKAGLALGLVQISSAMYNCLVYYTGGYTGNVGILVILIDDDDEDDDKDDDEDDDDEDDVGADEDGVPSA